VADDRVTFLLTAKDLASNVVKGLKREVTGLGTATSGATTQTTRMTRAQSGMKNELRSTVASYVGVTAGVTALVAGLTAAADELIDNERLTAQTSAVIKSTGGVANVTAKQVVTMSEDLEDLTTVERQVTQEAANMLLTFTNVRNEAGAGNDIFNQTTEAVLDVSRALGKDATDSAMLLGKALNDPVRGMTAMTRAGIQFTDQQKEMIKALVESGDLLGAQKIILAELETQFGGSAEAFANTAAGKIERFKNDVGDMFESILLGAIKVGETLNTEVDLWPFDTAVESERAASAGLAMGTAYANGLSSAITAVEPEAEAIAVIPVAAIRDQFVAMRTAAFQTQVEYAKGLADAQDAPRVAMEALRQMQKDVLTKAQEEARLLGQLNSKKLAAGLADERPAVREQAEATRLLILAQLESLGSEALGWGHNIARGMAAGLRVGKGELVVAAAELGGAIRGQLGVESEPKDHSSPLYGHMQWMPNFVDDLATTMTASAGALRDASHTTASALVPDLTANGPGAGMSSFGAGTSGGITIQATYAPQFSTASPSEGQAFARALAPSLVTELRRQGLHV